MKHFLWMHPWDLEGWEPDEFLDQIADAGIDELRLALAYHGGRLLLPRNRRHLVYEQHDGAVYFPPDRKLYGVIQPAEGPHVEAVMAFLSAASRRRFPVRAWLVLCHNDWLGRQHPQFCIRNNRGEAYSYALCPAQPEVHEYVVALIRDATRLPGISGLDLEALSFMGYEHNSLHDKRAIDVDPRLNVCHCRVCQGQQDRVAVIARILDGVNRVTGAPIDLRYTDDPDFYGGKTYLPPEALPGRVASLTRTFFAKPALEMTFATSPPVPTHVGFQFHPHDTRSSDELRERYARASGSAGVGFYCYGLANDEHWTWLKDELHSRLR